MLLKRSAPLVIFACFIVFGFRMASSQVPPYAPHLNNEDHAELVEVASHFPIEERDRIVYIRSDNRVIAADPALLDGWTIVETEILPEIGDEGITPSPDIGIVGDVVSEAIDGEVLISPPLDDGDTSGDIGGSSGGSVGGNTGGTNGSVTGGLTGGTTGGTSGGVTGGTTGGVTGGTSSGGATGGITGGNTGGSTSSGNTGGVPGDSPGGTAAGGSSGGGSGGGGSNRTKLLYTQNYNWEEIYQPFQNSNLQGFSTPETNGTTSPHPSGPYRRVMSKKGFGYVQATFKLPNIQTEVHCAPMVLDSTNIDFAPTQTQDSPYMYVKLDCFNPGKSYYGECGAKYDRAIFYEKSNGVWRNRLEEKFWKPYMTFTAGRLIGVNVIAIQGPNVIGTQIFSGELFVGLWGGNHKLIGRVYPMGLTGEPTIFVKDYLDWVTQLNTNKQVGYVASMAQAKREFTWDISPVKSTSKTAQVADTGSWVTGLEIVSAKLSPDGMTSPVPFAPIHIANGGHTAHNPVGNPGVVFTSGTRRWDEGIVTIRNGVRNP